MQFAALVTKRDHGGLYNQLDTKEIGTKLKDALGACIPSTSTSPPLPLPDPEVTYVPFKPVQLAAGAYVVQLTVPGATADSIRHGLYKTGSLPCIRLQMQAGPALQLWGMRQGKDPMDRRYDGKRLTRLLRITAKDEVSLRGVAEVLRGMREAGMIEGASWVGGIAADGEGPGSALSLPQGALMSDDALTLNAALMQQQETPLQLPAWAPKLRPGEFVAVVWGMDKRFVERPAGLQLQASTQGAPEDHSLHGREGVPFMASWVRPGAEEGPAKPTPKPVGAPSSYATAAAAGGEAAAAARAAVAAAAAAPPGQAGKEAEAPAAPQGEMPVGREQVLVQRLEQMRQMHSDAEKQTKETTDRLMDELRENKTLRAELDAVKKQLKEQEQQPSQAACGPAPITQGQSDAPALQEQLAAMQEQLMQVQAAAHSAQAAQAAAEASLKEKRQQLDATQAALQQDADLKKTMLILREPIKLTGTIAQPQAALEHTCVAAIQKLLRIQAATYKGSSDAPTEAVQQAAQAVCTGAISKWGMAAVKDWHRQGAAAAGTLTVGAILGLLPKDWDAPWLSGTREKGAPAEKGVSVPRPLLSPAGRRMVQTYLCLPTLDSNTTRHHPDGPASQNWLQRLLPADTQAQTNSSEAKVVSLLRSCMIQLVKAKTSNMDQRQQAWVMPDAAAAQENVVNAGLAKMGSACGDDWRKMRDWLLDREKPAVTEEEVEAAMAAAAGADQPHPAPNA